MTKEEIKEQINMSDVLSRYGIQVRNGMCRCPFHGHDRHPSMKVYRDGVRCFTCGRSWDVFSFIQQIDHCDFKTAFYSLGGTYEHQSGRAAIMAKAQRVAAQSKRLRASMEKKELTIAIHQALMICQDIDKVYEPYSEEWCEAKNAQPLIEYIYDERLIKDQEIQELSDLDVYRECRKLIDRFLPNARDIQ